MNMNKRQLVAIWVGIAILVLIFIIPPWKFIVLERSGIGKIEKPGSYASIFSPPEIPVSRVTEYGTEYFLNYPRKMWTAEIDFDRIALFSGAVVLITTGLIITFRKQS